MTTQDHTRPDPVLWVDRDLSDVEVDRIVAAAMSLTMEDYRAIVVALEAEGAAMAEALTAATHAFEQCSCGRDTCGCNAQTGPPDDVCAASRADPVHQTPAEVRRRHGFGAV